MQTLEQWDRGPREVSYIDAPNSRKVQTTQTSVDTGLGKQKGMFSYNGVLSGHKKKRGTDTAPAQTSPGVEAHWAEGKKQTPRPRALSYDSIYKEYLGKPMQMKWTAPPRGRRWCWGVIGSDR